MSEDTKRDPVTSLRLPPGLHKRVGVAARRAGQSRSEWIRRAILSMLKTESERRA